MNELIKANENLPTFMQNDVGDGTNELNEFVRPPRIKVVQALSTDLTDLFEVGDVVITPQNLMVSPVLLNENGKPVKLKTSCSEPLRFIPVFFWVEYIKWNDKRATSENTLLERTCDPKSELATLCRNQKTWNEPHPTNADWSRKNVEHLNYIVVVESGELQGTPLCISFARSEHKAGVSFASLIKMRKAPIYGCVFEMITGFRTNDLGEWYGVDIKNPKENPFIEVAGEYEALQNMHKEMKEAHANQLIAVDYEDPEDATPSSVEF